MKQSSCILPMDSGDVSSLLLLSCSLRKETLDWSYFKGTAAFAFFRRLFFLSALALQLQKKQILQKTKQKELFLSLGSSLGQGLKAFSKYIISLFVNLVVEICVLLSKYWQNKKFTDRGRTDSLIINNCVLWIWNNALRTRSQRNFSLF